MRRIAAVVGGVVVVMGAWACNGDPTGPRLVVWNGGATPLVPGARTPTPSSPIVIAQTLRQGGAPAAPAGSAVR